MYIQLVCGLIFFTKLVLGLDVKVVNALTNNPIENVLIDWGSNFKTTDGSGIASINESNNPLKVSLSHPSFLPVDFEWDPERTLYFMFPYRNSTGDDFLIIMDWQVRDPDKEPTMLVAGPSCFVQLNNNNDKICDQKSFKIGVSYDGDCESANCLSTILVTMLDSDVGVFKIYGGKYQDANAVIFTLFSYSRNELKTFKRTNSNRRQVDSNDALWEVATVAYCNGKLELEEENNIITDLTPEEALTSGDTCLKTGALIGALVGVVLGVVVALIVIVVIKKRRYLRSKLNRDIELQDSTPVVANVASTTTPHLSIKGVPEISDIKVCEKISEGIKKLKSSKHQGNFGDVFRGTWLDTEVALKKLKSEDVKKFEQEASILFQIGSHPHVVQFFGLFNSPENESYIVMEFMTKGSLGTALRGELNSLKLQDLLDLIIGACSGMTYLEKKKILHRDLACRNILVTKIDEKYRVKVSDFGLAKGLDEGTYYRSTDDKPLPIRWTAPEVLNGKKFTIASDVWAFGVTSWEILEFGKIPYNWLNNKEVSLQVPKGERLPKPDICTDDLWNILKECFESEPDKRPSFQHLLTQLQKYKENLLTNGGNVNSPSPPENKIIRIDYQIPHYNDSGFGNE